jgi:hypothetical protein
MQKPSFLAKVRNVWFEQVVKQGDRWVLLLIVSFSWWLMSFTFQYHNNQFVMASKVWSDFGAHLPLIRSFSMGLNFPPEYPQFPGESIRYHYLFYALVGWLEFVGLRIDLALNILSTLGLTLMLWMVYVYAKNMVNSVGAGLLALVMVLSNGSLSWWQFTQEYLQTLDRATFWQASSGWFTAVVKQVNFAAFGPWDGGVISAFWTLNIYTNQRHLPLSYGLVLLLLWPLVQTLVLKQRFVLSRWKALGIVAAMSLFPLLHQAGVAILIGSICVLLATHLSRHFLHQNWRLVLTYGLSTILVALAMSTLIPSGHPIIVKLWFLAKETTWHQIANYWWQNIGLYAAACLVLPWWSHRTRIFTILAGGLLVATNIWQLSPDMINNHKLVTFALLYLSISMASFMVVLWRKPSLRVSNAFIGRPWLIIKRTFLVFLFIGLTLGGVIDYFPIVNDHKIAYADWPKQPVAVWIKQNTNPGSVFLTTEFFYHPANIVGRKIYVDYGYFAWSLGYKDQDRRRVMYSLFDRHESLSDWCWQAQTNNIDYVVISPKTEVIDDRVVIRDSFVMNRLEPTVITDDQYRVYSVASNCQTAYETENQF